MPTSRCCRTVVILFVLAAFVSGQTPQAGGLITQSSPGSPVQGSEPAGYPQSVTPVRPDYVLGPGDQILLRVPQEEQINERPFRIDEEGNVALPLVGSIRASGVTVQALEGQIADALRKYIRDPLVSITVVQFRSDPVFFVGAFQSPGIYPLQGRRTLVEMLAAVGGIQPNASRRIKVTRRSEYGPIPLANAVEDPEKKTSTVEISLASLTQNINPAEDIVLQAYDIVSVERAESVYVSGDVARVGPIELGEREAITVVQAVTTAGGFRPSAKRKKVIVLRPILGTSRRAALEIDTTRIFEGKEQDFPLLPNDVLYVPRDTTKATLQAMGTSMMGSLPFLLVGLLVRR